MELPDIYKVKICFSLFVSSDYLEFGGDDDVESSAPLRIGGENETLEMRNTLQNPNLI